MGVLFLLLTTVVILLMSRLYVTSWIDFLPLGHGAAKLEIRRKYYYSFKQTQCLCRFTYMVEYLGPNNFLGLWAFKYDIAIFIVGKLQFDFLFIFAR